VAAIPFSMHALPVFSLAFVVFGLLRVRSGFDIEALNEVSAADCNSWAFVFITI